MLMLLFHAGNNIYALESSLVVEVIPRITLKQISYAPDYVPGLFNYWGEIVPIIDLCHLIQGTPSVSLLSTRIVIVRHTSDDSKEHYVGLLAEKVIETLSKQDTELLDPGINLEKASYLGKTIIT